MRAKGGALSEQGGAERSSEQIEGSTIGQCRGVAARSLKWLPRSQLELPSLTFCCLRSTSHRGRKVETDTRGPTIIVWP